MFAFLKNFRISFSVSIKKPDSVLILSASSSVLLLGRVWLFATPWTAASQASLSFTISLSLLKLMSLKSVMLSNHLILCHPLLHLPSVFLRKGLFQWVSCKYWSFSFRISPSNEYLGLISFRMDWFDLFAVQGLSRVFSYTTVQKHQFFGAQLSL